MKDGNDPKNYGQESYDANSASRPMSQDRTYDASAAAQPRAGLSRGMKIYLGIAIPLLILVIAALVYVIFFVKPPEGGYSMNTQTTAPATVQTVPATTEATTTTTAAATTTPAATTTTTTTTAATTTTTTTTAATTTTTTTTAATTTTTAATTTTQSEEDQIAEALAELNAEAAEIEAPVNGFRDNPRREGVYTILVLGLDQGGKRTDTMMMLTLDTQKKDIRIMSIPRDLMSTSVFGNYIKINAAYAQGIDETISQVSRVLGYTPNRYVVLDYDAFERLIDAIGGVEIDVFMDMKYDDYSGNLHIDLKEGPQLLDGEKALHYVRFRSGYAAADIKRIEIGQEFLAAVITKLASPATLLHVPELADVFVNHVRTDLSLGEIIWLTLQYYDMDTRDIHWGKVPTHSQLYDGQWYEVAYEGNLVRRINEGKYNPYENVIEWVDTTQPPEEPETTAAEGAPAETTAAAGG